MVRTLRQRAWVQSLGQGTKILQAMQCGKKKKKKITNANCLYSCFDTHIVQSSPYSN